MVEKCEGPPALIEVAVKPLSEAEQEKLHAALAEMAAEDPSFGFCTDREAGQTVVQGVSELQLDHKIDLLKLVYGVHPNFGAPQVAYRETIGQLCQIDYTHKKRTGGTGQFARVRIQFIPGEPESGFVFESRIVGGSVPEEFIPGVEKGLESARQSGLLAGFPVTDFTAILVDGAFHDVDSSELTFEIAARAAFNELRNKGAPRLLEPIMKVELLTPDEYQGDVIADLNSRRGYNLGTGRQGDFNVVTALVPLANMFGYVGVVHHLFDGRVEFTMQYDHYERAPSSDPEPPEFPPAVGMRA
jgi:elongation factor G